ncbi:pyruvate, phosphate dikinase [Candidatus Woesearchaeota archaeon]|nr:pyruvate, phosphate dikinase [Candidatus Woesearchaeota archaeon]
MTGKKYVYSFDEGDKGMKELLGGKGANLAEMTKLGLPIPPGFTITTEVCDLFYKNGKKYPEGAMDQVDEKLKQLEEKMEKKLGDAEDPLLVSVRSGAAESMPGMMDTVLNLGLNDVSVQGIIKKTENERFAWDAYRRFIQMFGDVVMGIEHANFEEELEKAKETKGVKFDTELEVEDLKKLVESYKKVIREAAGKDFPQDAREQLQMSIDAVFGSWNNPRAITYRRLNEITGLLGTAVNVQTMVFGNKGDTSGTGVAFTRNPSTGENKFYGEYLINAQGEDVVAGIRTPQPIEKLNEVMPDNYKALVEIRDKLEKHYTDMQDLEFTIEEGELYILQTRNGKRTTAAAVKMAVDMEKEGLIDQDTAILRIDPKAVDQLLHKRLDPVAVKEQNSIAKGLPASPGAAVGKIAFTAEDARLRKEEGEDVILVRVETSPEDIEGMHAASGILTARGGMTSHAAVVARGMGTCCVAGCDAITISEKEKKMTVGDLALGEDDWITLDGTTGEVYEGQIPVIDPELSGDFAAIMEWADDIRKLKVKTNADTPHDAEVAKKFGAEGIGLCRTEHMFFEGERIKAVREMILAKDEEGRKAALDKLLPYQKDDFKGLFKVMDKLPVIVRLLDPPLHEFLPKEDKDIKELADDMNFDEAKLRQKIEDLHEFNPMLGFRGCRLGVRYPEINEMQIRAIFKAALESKDEGIEAVPYIEVPLVGNKKEFLMIKEIIDKVAEELAVEGKISYKVGTMIEVPRAAVTAEEIAKEVEFMSFGTNDLTQMSCGFSRDDAGKFLNLYVEKGIYERDPFQAIDQEGVGKLMQMCVDSTRKVNKDIEIGICGEHGGEPSSVEFCHRIGLNEVSCSPFRVPIARLAAAQAVIREKK